MAVFAFIITIPAFKGNHAGLPVAFLAVTSISVIGLYIAYTIPVFLRWRMGDAFQPGPWTLGRKYKWINVIAIVWVALCVIIFCLPFTPAAVPWNSAFSWSAFNYAPLVTIIVMLAVTIWYYASARHTFKGPIHTIEFAEDGVTVVDPAAAGACLAGAWRSWSPPPRRCSRRSRAPTPLTSIARCSAPRRPSPRGGRSRRQTAPPSCGRCRDVVGEHLEELAQLEARNAGKPIGDARGEMGMVAQVFGYYAGSPERLLGDTIPVAGGQAWTVREPLGVVGLIVPWNFPLTIAAWKMGPALAAGNTIVLKPAELTPLTALRFAELALEAGLPEGVLNVVVGPGSVCGARLVEHPGVAKIAFTGSTEVGRSIAAGAAQTIKRVTLELGGKSPNVVFADADLAAAAAAAPGAVFGNAGQDCCARSRILVQREAMDEFMSGLERAVTAIRVGDPLAEDTEMGPLISAGQRATVGSFVDDGAPVAFRGIGARRARVLVCSHGPVPGGPGGAGRTRGDLRTGGRGHPVRH